jgi:cytochrome c5
MKSVYVKIAAFILIAGLLSACGGQAPQAPASQPTEVAALVNGAPANPTAQGAAVSFAKDVLPILQSRCQNCHGGGVRKRG